MKGADDWTSRTMELEDLYWKCHHDGLEIVQIAYRNRNPTAPPLQRDRTAMERHVMEKKMALARVVG